MENNLYDFIVVGSGAGGSTIIKELVSRGAKILLIEKGSPFRKLGKFFPSLSFYNFNKYTKMPQKTIEGVNYYQGFAFGGTTLFSCGNAVVSLKNELLKIGVDIADEIREIQKEIPYNKTDKSLFSSFTNEVIKTCSTNRIMFEVMTKFIENKKCIKCGNCVFGCKYGAKWSSNKLIDKKELDIKFNSNAIRVITNKGKAIGIEYQLNKQLNKAYGKNIIISAGAIHTPIILLNSGLVAGENLSLDLFVNVYGSSSSFTQINEPVMPIVYLEKSISDGFIISPFINQPFFIRMFESNLKTAMIKKQNLVGFMVKIKDDSNGNVFKNGRVSKPVTNEDMNKINKGINLSKDIMDSLGVEDISVTCMQGAHPIGTAAIGTVVDNKNFMTEIKNLYVCDSSILPEAPGLPPILTIMALAKKFTKQF